MKKMNFRLEMISIIKQFLIMKTYNKYKLKNKIVV